MELEHAASTRRVGGSSPLRDARYLNRHPLEMTVATGFNDERVEVFAAGAHRPPICSLSLAGESVRLRTARPGVRIPQGTLIENLIFEKIFDIIFI